MVSVKPVWVWHEAAVPGHIFLCVMGLMLLHYLQWEERDLHLLVKELTERLRKIRVAAVMVEKRLRWVVEEMGIEEAQLAARFKLLVQLSKVPA